MKKDEKISIILKGFKDLEEKIPVAFSLSGSPKTTTLGFEKRFSEAGFQICKNSKYKYILVFYINPTPMVTLANLWHLH